VEDMTIKKRRIYSRDIAKRKIIISARRRGIKGVFYVVYNNRLMLNPYYLPKRVDMDKIKILKMLGAVNKMKLK
jgi:hypothetical protein